jgi:hypothetical protein
LWVLGVEEGFALEYPSLRVETGAGSFLPSFLQREGWLFQAQARLVARSRKASGSRMASNIIPVGTANRSR